MDGLEMVQRAWLLRGLGPSKYYALFTAALKLAPMAHGKGVFIKIVSKDQHRDAQAIRNVLARHLPSRSFKVAIAEDAAVFVFIP